LKRNSPQSRGYYCQGSQPSCTPIRCIGGVGAVSAEGLGTLAEPPASNKHLALKVWRSVDRGECRKSLKSFVAHRGLPSRGFIERARRNTARHSPFTGVHQGPRRTDHRNPRQSSSSLLFVMSSVRAGTSSSLPRLLLTGSGLLSKSCLGRTENRFHRAGKIIDRANQVHLKNKVNIESRGAATPGRLLL